MCREVVAKPASKYTTKNLMPPPTPPIVASLNHDVFILIKAHHSDRERNCPEPKHQLDLKELQDNNWALLSSYHVPGPIPGVIRSLRHGIRTTTL